MKLKIETASDSDNQLIQESLTRFNVQTLPSLPYPKSEKLDFVIKINNEFIGGINAELVNWGILFISLLFVDERFRSKGYGQELIKHVEKLGKDKGAYLAHTDTFDFQAKDFYVKQGYEVFGVLDNCPKGHKRYYLKKDL